MRMILAVFFSALVFSAPAFASCYVYAEPGHQYKGDMITTGSSWVGVPPGASDSTPYAGALKGCEVFLSERSPTKIATVSGNMLLNLNGAILASVEGKIVKDERGNIIATVETPYSPDGLCQPDVALAGVAFFLDLK